MTTDENSNQPLIAIIVLILGMVIFSFLFNILHKNYTKQKQLNTMTNTITSHSLPSEVIEGGEIIQGNTYFGYWQGYIVTVGKTARFSVNKSAKNCKCIVYIHDKKAEVVAFEEN